MAKEIYIAGEWRLGRGAVIQSLFPADQSVNAELSTATLEDVNEAIEKQIRLGVNRAGETVCRMSAHVFSTKLQTLLKRV